MNIEKKLDGDNLVISLEGRLDTMTAPELEEVIKGNVDGVKALTIDMTKLEYISSAGLRTLLMAKKLLQNKGVVKVTNINEIVREVFEVTGFIDLLDIE